ncbi:LysE family translocator [Mesorhizobium sp. INR15]|uniref:LysE family translocator n=1 Tax=Mesorhizobium sp. INR15 TaxID=2654248 RepID=UPI00189684ED|nr:LysE family transporter [Mesorhizobium sp. INR15]QPC94585.1 lysine transporter LysE [Mesorhizobium sp. INR15]
MSDPILFVLSVVALLSTPGPSNTLLAASGAVAGVRRSLPLLAGELTGYLAAIGLIRLALEPLLDSPVVNGGFKLVVVAYLAFTARGLWNASAAASPSIIRTRGVFATTLINPKAFVFSVVIIPHGVVNIAPYLAAFSACVVVVGFLWVAFGHIAGRRFYLLAPRIASVVLGGFASLMLLSIVG